VTTQYSTSNRWKSLAGFMQLFGERDLPTRTTGAGHDLGDLEPIGVVDIGSNSVRLVVYDGAIRSPTPLFNEKVLCGLGRSVATSGRLGTESVERAIVALTRFRAIARVLGVKNLRAIATAAVREASDGPDFIQRGTAALGIRIEILSGEQEACFAAEGIMMGFVNANGIAGDLGGGSLELIDIAGDTLKSASTLPLGGLRLIDTSGDKIEKAGALIDEALARVPWIAAGKGRPFYAVGGTWRALARVHMDHSHYPLRVMHGYAIPARSAQEFCESLRRTKKLGSVPGVMELAKARREVLPYGAYVLERLLAVMQPSEVVFSVFGVREGLLYALLPPHERAKDPLLCFAEDYARQRSRSVEHAHELCAWTDSIFADPAQAETADERRLRHAACLMSDIGWRAHPDYRGEQSLNVVAHSSLGGIDHQGRIFLALAVYYRHTGPGEAADQPSQRLRDSVTKRALKRARIVGAAIRAAHMLSIGVAGIIDETPLSYEPGKLVLTLPQSYAGLDGERLRRRLDHLAQLLDRQAAVKMVS
jgi:exopolyphosphatase / guanosine-5'-triphosphate,3'-diphosphate pyrophosphatase